MEKEAGAAFFCPFAFSLGWGTGERGREKGEAVRKGKRDEVERIGGCGGVKEVGRQSKAYSDGYDRHEERGGEMGDGEGGRRRKSHFVWELLLGVGNEDADAVRRQGISCHRVLHVARFPSALPASRRRDELPAPLAMRNLHQLRLSALIGHR